VDGLDSPISPSRTDCCKSTGRGLELRPLLFLPVLPRASEKKTVSRSIWVQRAAKEDMIIFDRNVFGIDFVGHLKHSVVIAIRDFPIRCQVSDSRSLTPVALQGI
jgi:hypothetical protein